MQEETAFTCSLLKASFVFQGGRISDSESLDVTHVIVQRNDSEGLELCKKMNRLRLKKFHIVTYDWIESCCACQRHLHEGDFHPNSELYSNKK